MNFVFSIPFFMKDDLRSLNNRSLLLTYQLLRLFRGKVLLDISVEEKREEKKKKKNQEETQKVKDLNTLET